MKLLKRIINFLRPKPQYIKMPLDEILKNTSAKNVIENFNDFYYTSSNAGDLIWRGDKMIKNPCDLWSYTEIIQDLKPSLIIETGTHMGASANFFADICRILNLNTMIVTIDINPKWSFEFSSKNIISLVGLSTENKVFQQVYDLYNKVLKENPGNVIVILDSDHSKENVYNEIKMYSDLVSLNSYLIVEDTNINGHPSYPTHGPGPWEAVEEFLKEEEGSQFIIDKYREKYMLTYNPNGYLKRVKKN